MTLAEVLGKHGIDTASLTDTTVAGGTETFALLAIQGSAVVGHWQRLRDLVGETSHWPVLLGDEAFTFQLLGDLEDADFSPSENIAAGLNLDVLDWIEQGYAKAPAWSIDLWHSRDNEEGSPTGDSANPDLLYAPTGTNYIALLPTTQSWQCPAWFSFGGYNDCPDPEVHVAILKIVAGSTRCGSPPNPIRFRPSPCAVSDRGARVGSQIGP